MAIKRINAIGKSVLIISDTHFPYTHKDYYKFLKAVKKKYTDKNSIICHVGDELDFHSKFEITYSKSPIVERYNMFIGCLVDLESLAFAYGRNNLPKPILGLGYIDKLGQPLLIKMQLNKKGRWNGKI